MNGEPAVTFRRPFEALLLDRVGLLQLLRRSLAELHEQRCRFAGAPADPEILHRITYWEGVLAWVKDLQGPDVILMSRRS